MDWIRTAGVQRVKLWADSDEVTEIRWFRAAEGALVFPSAHRYFHPAGFMDRGEWILAPWEVGIPTYDTGANVLGYPGVTFCGSPEAYAAGGLHGVDPVITADDYGNSTCCGGEVAMVSEGGIAIGGEADMSIETPWTACGDGSNSLIVTVPDGQALRLRFASVNATDDGGAPYTWTLSTSHTGDPTCVMLSGSHDDDWDVSVWGGQMWIPEGRTLRFESVGPSSSPHWHLSGEMVTL